jgi:methyltransferase (TIGR00027 family)
VKLRGPSKTAYGVAVIRAAHQLLDQPKVLDDPIALSVLGPQADGEVRSRRQRGSLSRHLRAFVVARSRFVEDELAQAVKRGVRQYVVLGAGLDTFAYRNPHPLLRVFEVDHPNTQAWKRAQLAANGIAIPATTMLVPVDFEQQTAGEELVRAGWNPEEPSFFSCLGVTMYLEPESVMATLKQLAAAPAGSQFVFDYVPASSGSLRLRIMRFVLSLIAAAYGEPWKTDFDPAFLTGKLREFGFAQTQDMGPAEINALYFAGRADGMRSVGGRLMSARR